ncbi:MAG TPA: TIM-barrel domain-containing protein [Candidatus Polarisedimenticolia bacterium]|nr:TIM-barrel domain-containing protein [Candidatus Polarisedimenticolia bacterium]
MKMPKINIRARWIAGIALALSLAITLPGFAQPKDVDDVDPAGSAAKPVQLLASVTNNPVLPPKWAFGVLFACYRNQADTLDAMQRLRKDYCGDLLWIDSSWLWGAYDRADRYICFQFDTNQFSDPKAMIATLHQNHFHFGVWEWPYIDQSITNLYQEGKRGHYFITDQLGGTGKVVNGGGWHGVTFTGQLDFTNPKAVAWWELLNKPLLDLGVDFFKIDTYSTVAKGGVTYDGSGSENLRRLYHKTYYDMTEYASGGRGFILTHRTPTPGNDQYPGMWTGDTTTSWAGFEDDMKRAAAMNTPQTAAFWTSDTGGYNRDIPNHDELYIRWLQYGTFLPITEFFSAKNTKGRFPWLFNKDAQRNFKFYTQLRYRLLPFRYSNAQIAYHETPVKYPVRFVEGTKDEIIVGNGDSEMLVAPVHVRGATTRQVKLPAENSGTGVPSVSSHGQDARATTQSWIDYWTGKVYDGGSSPVVDAPLDKVPIFVKTGSLIPMGPEMHYVDEKPADPLTVDIYPSAKSSYTLFEDDGKSDDYKNGKFTQTQFACETIAADAIVQIAAMQGDYDGKLTHRSYILKINRRAAALRRVTRNGAPLQKFDSKAALDSAEQGWFNDLARATVWVKFPTATSAASKVVLNGLNLTQ